MTALATTPRDPELRRLLAHHYGDGAIYLPRDAGSRDALGRARAAGLVSSEGFITRRGRRFLARTESMTPPWVS